MTKWKKTAAMVLAGILALSFIACGSDTAASGPQGNISTASSSMPSENSNDNSSSGQDAAVDPYMKFDPVITMSTLKGENSFEFPEGEDFENNDVYKMFEEIAGVKITNKILAPGNAMKEKMQMAIVSNDIPDFGEIDTTMLRTLIKNGMVEDMTDLYETWASDHMKEVTEQSDKSLFAPAMEGDRIMAIPLANTVADQMPILWIRGDWLEKLGLEAPATMEELLEIGKAFATQDPDGNGADDTYALYLDKDLSNLEYFCAAYGVFNKQWNRQPDGSFQSGYTDPKMKQALSALANLYAIGGIDPEFAVVSLFAPTRSPQTFQHLRRPCLETGMPFDFPYWKPAAPPQRYWGSCRAPGAPWRR